MSYLIASHWGWLLAALFIGGIVGFLTFARPRRGWVDLPVIVAAIVFVLAALVALFKLVPGRSGYWLELALLMVAAYVIGCFIGWLAKYVTAGSDATDTALAPAMAGAAAAPVAVPPPVAQPVPSVSAVSLPPPAPVLPDEAEHAGTRPAGYAAARAGRPDDLKRIKGIGRQNEARLHSIGVWHFEQIAAWTPENVAWVGSYLAFPGRIDREQWVAQAKVLAAGGETEFSRRVAAGEVPSSRGEGA